MRWHMALGEALEGFRTRNSSADPAARTPHFFTTVFSLPKTARESGRPYYSVS